MTPAQVYRFFNASGDLLYVGVSISVMNRLQGHRIAQPWFKDISIIKIEHFEDRLSAYRAEREAIAKEKPIFNIEPGKRKTPRLSKTVSVSQGAAILGITREQMIAHPHIKRIPHWSGTENYSPRFLRSECEKHAASSK